jgi:hypothetical protein
LRIAERPRALHRVASRSRAVGPVVALCVAESTKESIMKTASFRRSLALRLFPIFAALFAGCVQEAAPLPDDLLAADQAFVAVPNGSGADGASAYLAIRKDVLDRPSFQLRNGKLLVLDLSAPRADSPVIYPPNLLDAYPVVDLPAFARLRGADRYVVIDPSADKGFKPGPEPIDPVF